MNMDLIIAIPDTPTEPWVWRQDTGDEEGRHTGTARSASDKRALAERGARHITVLLSGQSIRMIAHDLPKLRAAEQRSAAELFIEDQLAAPIRDQHIIIADTEPKRIAVIARQKLQHVLDTLSEAGLDPHCVYADFDVLPKRATSYICEDRTITAGPLGYTSDTDGKNISDTLANLLAKLSPENALNLRQGEFAKRREFYIPLAQLSRAAALLAVLSMSWLLLTLSQSRALTTQVDHLRQDARDLYTEATGETAPPNPALALTRRLNAQTSTGPDFLTLSQMLFDTIENANGITIDRLQYNAAQNQIDLRLVYPRFESAPLVERMARDKGARLQTGSVREQDGRFIGEATFSLEARP